MKKKIVEEGRIKHCYYIEGAKGDWDFQISDLVKNTDGTDI